MFSPFIFWPWFTGLIFLAGGLLIFRSRVAKESGIDKVVALGPVLYAVPLAVFGAEHLAGARFLMTIVPRWIPGQLFWTYFVGIALICAAISIISMRYVGLSGTLLGVMLFCFVLLIHLPRVLANPADRIAWAVVLRDLCFGGAAWALAGQQMGSRGLIEVARATIAIAAIFFGTEHFLHPHNVPGVPLEKMMPPWIPLAAIWSFFTGAALLAAGAALVFRKADRAVLTWIGALVTLLVLIVYAPMLAVATTAAQMTEAINYIADTMLFAGTLLVMARALPLTSH